MMEVMRKQRTGTGAIRRQIPPSEPKWEITKITNRNKWVTEWAAISQKVVTQQPKPN